MLLLCAIPSCEPEELYTFKAEVQESEQHIDSAHPLGSTMPIALREPGAPVAQMKTWFCEVADEGGR